MGSKHEFHLHERAVREGAGRPIGLRDVAHEHDRVKCEVDTTTGPVPAWIAGALFRQSGGAFLSDSDAEAFLDGLAHISSYAIKDGGVTYSNKYMRTADFSAFAKTGKRTWGGTNVAPPSGDGAVARALKGVGSALRWALGAGGDGGDDFPAVFTGFQPNVNIFQIGKSLRAGDVRLAASTETDGTVCEFDPETLETVAAVPTMAAAKGQVITNAAHWFATGTRGGYHAALELSWKMGMSGPKFTFRYAIFHGMEAPYKRLAELELATFGWADRAKQAPQDRASYMHSVAQTPNHVVLLLSSKRMRYESLLARDFSKGFFGLFETVDEPLGFAVFRIGRDADGAETLDYVDTVPCPATDDRYMVWHLANCFDDDQGRIVIDATVVRVPAPDAAGATARGALNSLNAGDGATSGSDSNSGSGSNSEEKNELARFTIDVQARSVVISPVVSDTSGGADPDADFEFPNINPAYNLRPYRYAYFLRKPFQAGSRVGIVDVEAPNEPRYLEGLHASEIPSEPLFVARPGATDELDGVVLVETIDTETNTSNLVVATPTATSFAVTARVKSPMPGNLGLHSTWVPHLNDDDATIATAISKY